MSDNGWTSIILDSSSFSFPPSLPSSSVAGRNGLKDGVRAPRSARVFSFFFPFFFLFFQRKRQKEQEKEEKPVVGPLPLSSKTLFFPFFPPPLPFPKKYKRVERARLGPPSFLFFPLFPFLPFFSPPPLSIWRI